MKNEGEDESERTRGKEWRTVTLCKIRRREVSDRKRKETKEKPWRLSYGTQKLGEGRKATKKRWSSNQVAAAPSSSK